MIIFGRLFALHHSTTAPSSALQADSSLLLLKICKDPKQDVQSLVYSENSRVVRMYTTLPTPVLRVTGECVLTTCIISNRKI